MKFFKSITAVVLSLCLLSQVALPVAYAAPVKLTQSQVVAKQVDTLLSQTQQSGSFSGTVLLTQNGKTLLSKSYGYSNEEYKIPASDKTVYRYASLSKQLTAASVLKLVEQGKLKLDDPINQYIKDFPNGDQITIKMLLNHTSGLRDDMKSTGKTNDEFIKVYHSPAELAALIAQEKLGAKPGETYFYSNHGYILLGYIIETVSGKSYETYLKESILTPLGITGIQLDNNKAIIPNRAEGYNGVGAKKQKAAYIDMSNAYAAGGLVGTAASYLKWQQSYYSPKVLTKDSWDQLFKGDVKTLRSPLMDERYGLGVMSTTLSGFGSQSYTLTYHTGGVNGFRNFQLHFEALGIDLVLLSNNEALDLEAFLTQLLFIMMGLMG